MITQYVAIIGTREPDPVQQSAAFNIARQATARGIGVTTGAADGIDHQAMLGAHPGLLHVVLPWATYNKHLIPKGVHKITVYNPAVHKDWTESVKKYHPAFHMLTRGPLALHARNFGIIKPVIAVAAFPDDKGGGGTGQGIRIAKDLGIPLLQVNRHSHQYPDDAAIVNDFFELLRKTSVTVTE